MRTNTEIQLPTAARAGILRCSPKKCIVNLKRAAAVGSLGSTPTAQEEEELVCTPQPDISAVSGNGFIIHVVYIISLQFSIIIKWRSIRIPLSDLFDILSLNPNLIFMQRHNLKGDIYQPVMGACKYCKCVIKRVKTQSCALLYCDLLDCALVNVVKRPP